MDLRAATAELYGLAPREFVSRRDALAVAARRNGDKDLAAAIKALRRPTVGAWLANLLVRQRPDEVAALLALGEQVRAAQAQLSATDMRGLTQRRRQAVAALVGAALEAARALGEAVSEQARTDLEGTLAAAVLDDQVAAALGDGNLVAPLHYAGLGLTNFAPALEEKPLPAKVGAGPAAAATPAAENTPAAGTTAGRAARSPRSGATARTATEVSASAAKAERELRAAESALAQAEVVEGTRREELARLKADHESAQGQLDRLYREIAHWQELKERADQELALASAHMEAAEQATAAARRLLSEVRQAST